MENLPPKNRSRINEGGLSTDYSGPPESSSNAAGKSSANLPTIASAMNIDPEKETPNLPRPSKRKKPCHQVLKKVKIERGALSELKLSKLPNEVFAEITSFLQPRDLLNLARVSMVLRPVLMTKWNRPIWVSSRKNLPSLPECPKDLSEPAYASLVFDTECQQCGSKKAQSIELQYRLRACDPCSRRHCVPAQGNLRTFRALLESSGLLKLGTGDDELESIRSLVLRSDNGGANEYAWLFGPSVLQVYNQCRIRRTQMKRADYEEYLHQRLTDMEGIKEHAQKLASWNDMYLEAKRKENGHNTQALSNKRCLEITKRLTERGFVVQDFPHTPNQYEGFMRVDNAAKYKLWRKLALRPAVLVEEGEMGWNTIKPQLEGMVSSGRASRLEMDHVPFMLLEAGPWCW